MPETPTSVNLIPENPLPHPTKKRVISRILVVGDGNVGEEGVFDWIHMVKAVRNHTRMLGSFEVSLAHRQSIEREGDSAFRYKNFRFDAMEGGKRVIDKYEQIWLFGIMPGNGGPQSDSVILEESKDPLSQSEIDALKGWMDAGGGVFATGDHFYLGASMCSRIPRVNTMRRWTIAQGVPTSTFEQNADPTLRIDTNRAVGASKKIMDGPNQSDATPQEIFWEAAPLGGMTDDGLLDSGVAMKIAYMPHPLLWHPTLGPIDVMPDHSHEGKCFGPTFNTPDADYPTVDGIKPEPEVVAYGVTLTSPPYEYQLGCHVNRTPFPMIVAYDGQRIDVGRVAVDSTWHHWFDYNLEGFDPNGSDYKKITRYFVNMAIWLASPHWRAWSIYGAIIDAMSGYFGQQTFNPVLTAYRTGRLFIPTATASLGRGWIRSIIFDDILKTFNRSLYMRIRNDFYSPCDPVQVVAIPRAISVDSIEAAVVGGLVKQVFARVKGLGLEFKRNEDWPSRISDEDMMEDLRLGTAHGLHEISGAFARESARSSALMEALGKASKRDNDVFQRGYGEAMGVEQHCG